MKTTRTYPKLCDACFNVSDYYQSSNDYPTMAFMEGQPFEVIGNIYDNPDLC
jgi:hypothetical protein